MGSRGKIQPSTQLFCIHKHGWNCAEDSLIKRTTFNTQSLKPKGTKSITYYIKSTASMVETWTSNPIFFILLSSVFELQDLAASKECALFRTWTTPVQYDRGLIASIDCSASNGEVFWGFWQEQVAHACAKSWEEALRKNWQSYVTLAAALLQPLLSRVRSCLAPKPSRLHLRC